MDMTDIVDFERRDGISDELTDLLRTGAQKLIASAVEAELEGFLMQYSTSRTKAGCAAVVRNGHHPARPVQTGIGPVSVRISKVRSKTGKPVTFHSALVPPYVRKTRSLEAALPWLYLKGVSSGEMGAAQNHECIELPAKIIPAKSQESSARHLAGRDPKGCRQDV